MKRFIKRTCLVNGIRLAVHIPAEEAYGVAIKQMRRMGLSFDGKPICRIWKRSVDARDKGNIYFVYSVAVTADMDADASLDRRSGAFTVSELRCGDVSVEYGNEALRHPPILVGSGPAGLFCALLLAENGYRPIVIERGDDIQGRVAKVERFSRERALDPDSNIQFGAGGAGTFSDGKLVTRINDPLSSYVLKRFCEFGAPEEILYLSKPHIGSDYLRTVVSRMTDAVRRAGGEVRFNTRFDRFASDSTGNVTSVSTPDGDIACGALVLALGHSARDTYRALLQTNMTVSPKPFSVGVRIEHLQRDIDFALYGKMAGDPRLGHAEYALSADTANRGVYTFCMCPGGIVVAAASEEGGVVVNGMSNHARDGLNANSAVAVSVRCEDYGNTPEAAIAFQRDIERRAFACGGGDYSVPLTTVGDFLSHKKGTAPTRIQPTYMGGNAYCLSSPDEYLPSFVTEQLRLGICQFERRITGFSCADAILTGAETRTSAPLRLIRDDYGVALGYTNVYPCGEGAGYAGGITSAAIDGIRAAVAIMKKYKPFQ